MKVVVSLIVAGLTCVSLCAQTSTVPEGRIVYRMMAAGKTSYIEMHFAGTDFAYRVVPGVDTSQYPFSMAVGRDRLLAATSENSNILLAEVNRLNGWFTFYNGSSIRKILSTANVAGVIEKRCTFDSSVHLQWQLLQGTDTLNGRVCGLATAKEPRSGNTIKAWYDLNIPCPVGPFQLSGLPGLVIKFESTSGAVASMQELQFPYTSRYESFLTFCDGCKLIPIVQAMAESKKGNEEILKFAEKLKEGKPLNIQELQGKQQ